MTPEIIQGYNTFWQDVYHYQALLAGSLALGAAVLTALYLRKQIKASVEEGKRDRDFRTKQHERERDFRTKQREIDKQTKRRDVAMMLAADIWSGIEIVNLAALAKTAKKESEKFKLLGEGESSAPPFFALIYQSFLNNYSHYIENIPLMRIETALEVSRFYLYAMNLSEVITLSNAKVEGSASNKTKAGFLVRISGIAKITQTQHKKTLTFLKEERKEAEIKLDRLNGVKEKSDASAP